MSTSHLRLLNENQPDDRLPMGWVMPDQDLHAQIESIYRTESRRVLATLIRLLGDFDRAEEALHDAVRAALEQWPRDGVPANPSASRGSNRF